MIDLVRKAIDLKRAGKPRQALPLLEESLEASWPSAFLLNHLGHCLLLIGELTQSRNVLGQAIRLDPKNLFSLKFPSNCGSGSG